MTVEQIAAIAVDWAAFAARKTLEFRATFPERGDDVVVTREPDYDGFVVIKYANCGPDHFRHFEAVFAPQPELDDKGEPLAIDYGCAFDIVDRERAS